MEPNSARTDGPVEARIARLESDVSHLRSDVGEVKLDLRSLRDKLDGVSSQLIGRIDGATSQLSDRADHQDAKLDELRDDLARAKVWAVMLYMSLAALNFGALARGFGWI